MNAIGRPKNLLGLRGFWGRVIQSRRENEVRVFGISDLAFSLSTATLAFVQSKMMNSVDKNLLARTISHFSKYTFTAFIEELFSDKNSYEAFRPIPEAGDDVFCQPLLDSYGGSIHSVTLLHFPPLELFRPSKPLIMNDPTLIQRLAKLRNIYHAQIGQWGMVSPFLEKDDALKSIKFVTNLYGNERKTYEDMLLPAYRRAMRFCGLKKPMAFIGSCDSFVDLDLEGTRNAFKKIMGSYSEGVAISISEHDVSVRDFTGERNLASGVSAGTRSAYEPLMVSAAVRQRAVLHEFEGLIKANVTEKILEEFLVSHYRDVFGTKYDRIETQLWLRFPGLDINSRDRRLDIFLRNSIKNDWELFEIKRPTEVTATYRDAPDLAAEVLHAIGQVRVYARILSQDKVKRHFASEGIEYYEPALNLVIGRTPQVPHEQWRWLSSENRANVQIFTFDELLSELRLRLEDRYGSWMQLLVDNQNETCI